MLAALATALAWTIVSATPGAPEVSGAPVASATLGPTASQTRSTLQSRADQIAAQVNARPTWPDDLFHPELFQELSPARLRSIFLDVHASCGAALATVPLDLESAFAGRFRLAFENAREATLTLRLEALPPHRVTGFFLSPPLPSLEDFEALGRELDALPGATSVLVAQLTEAGLEPLYERRAELRLGVGSTFKLYVLGALVADVAANKRRWNDTLVLNARQRSLSSGLLQTWPVGSPVTLHTLATLMISHSDNTATDHLLETLGRSAVEASLATLGHGEPARNTPLLTTRELFLLRSADGGAHAERYLALGTAERRAYLADTLAKIPLRRVDPLLLALPEDAARVEWFASTRDLCLALDWLRRATESAATRTARDLLAVSSGPAPAAIDLDYVGYKGGATGGVLNHSWLARTRDGTWLAVSATWNDTRSSLDGERFAGLAARALQLAADAHPARDG